jgi:hypothetical protein
MANTRASMAALDGARQPVSGFDLRRRVSRHALAARDAALVLATAALLLLVAS